MKTFIVAFISFFDNELKMKRVEAETDVEAALAYLKEEISDWKIESTDLKALKEECFNGDCMINVMEV